MTPLEHLRALLDTFVTNGVYYSFPREEFWRLHYIRDALLKNEAPMSDEEIPSGDGDGAPTSTQQQLRAWADSPVYLHANLRALLNDAATTVEALQERLAYEAHRNEGYDALCAKLKEAEQGRDAAYLERNRLVSLLSKLFPAGKKKTAIEGWDPEWHNCVFIDLPTGQASWHYHDREDELFRHLREYPKEWDGHTTEEKYARIAAMQIPPGCPSCGGRMTTLRATKRNPSPRMVCAACAMDRLEEVYEIVRPNPYRIVAENPDVTIAAGRVIEPLPIPKVRVVDSLTPDRTKP